MQWGRTAHALVVSMLEDINVKVEEERLIYLVIMGRGISSEI